MRLFEAIIEENHRAVAGDTTTSQLVTNRHQLKTGYCRVSQLVTDCHQLMASENELVANCYHLTGLEASWLETATN